MDPSNFQRESNLPLNTTSNQTQEPLVHHQAQNQQGSYVLETPNTTANSNLPNPFNPFRIVPRPAIYQANCCTIWFLKWYFYFLGIAFYFYIKAGYQIYQDKKPFQENGVLWIDIAACAYPLIFIIIECFAIMTANKKAALIAVWGFVSYFLLYLIYALVLYFDIAKDGNQRERSFTDSEFWLAFFTGTTLSGCYCVYNELCKYHKSRIPLEQNSDGDSYSRA